MQTIDTPKLYKTAVKLMSYDTLTEKCNALIDSNKKRVTFSIFTDAGTTNGVWMVKSPDIQSTKPVIEGNVVFHSNYWRITEYTDEETVYSKFFTNPTWKDIINAANDMLVHTCNYELFLEGLTLENSTVGGRQLIRFDFGS